MNKSEKNTGALEILISVLSVISAYFLTTWTQPFVEHLLKSIIHVSPKLSVVTATTSLWTILSAYCWRCLIDAVLNRIPTINSSIETKYARNSVTELQPDKPETVIWSVELKKVKNSINGYVVIKFPDWLDVTVKGDKKLINKPKSPLEFKIKLNDLVGTSMVYYFDVIPKVTSRQTTSIISVEISEGPRCIRKNFNEFQVSFREVS